MRLISLFLIVLFVFVTSPAPAQEKIPPEQKPIRVVVKDAAGEKTEGYLLIYPEEVAVSTKDQQQKSIPIKAIQSIKVEKIQPGIPVPAPLSGEEYYSVRLENSQELLTLDKKYTLSLTTSVGVVTKTLDPSLLSKEPSASGSPHGDKPFVRDKSLIFSLELKF
jgi:hypothetical protein